jgi:hypothetical protein
VAESFMDRGDSDRRYVLLAREGLELVRNRSRVARFAGDGIRDWRTS